jgi:uncharacterized protein (TIRG00374 family)
MRGPRGPPRRVRRVSDPGADDPAADPARRGRWSRQRLQRIAGIVVPLLVVVLVFAVLLPRIADYHAVWKAVEQLSWRDAAALIAAATLNVATFGPPWMAALPGLRYWRSMEMSMAATALSNVVPGGDAIGLATSYGMLRSWGFENQAVTLAVVVFGVWNQIVNVVFPVLAVVLLVLSGGHNRLLELAALIGLAALVVALTLFALALRSDRRAASIGRVCASAASRALRPVGRGPVGAGWPDALVRFREGAIGLLRRRWPLLTLWTLVGHLTVWLVLVVSLRVFGVGADQVSLVESFAAWSLVRVLTAIPITPGGVGIVELGLTGALVGFGGAQVQVVAAVLVYRALTFLPPIPLGAVSALVWSRRQAREARASS